MTEFKADYRDGFRRGSAGKDSKLRAKGLDKLLFVALAFTLTHSIHNVSLQHVWRALKEAGNTAESASEMFSSFFVF